MQEENMENLKDLLCKLHMIQVMKVVQDHVDKIMASWIKIN